MVLNCSPVLSLDIAQKIRLSFYAELRELAKRGNLVSFVFEMKRHYDAVVSRDEMKYLEGVKVYKNPAEFYEQNDFRIDPIDLIYSYSDYYTTKKEDIQKALRYGVSSVAEEMENPLKGYQTLEHYERINCKARNGVKVIKFVVDLNEPDYNESLKLNDVIHIAPHKTKTYSNCRADIAYQNYCYSERDPSKERLYDFVFGYAWRDTPSRNKLSEFIEKAVHQDEKHLIFGNDARIGMKNELPQEEYCSKVAQSKFSLIWEAYNPDNFSIQRFFECVFVGCVPLIYKDCAYKLGLARYPEIIEFYEKNNLLIDASVNLNLNEFIKGIDYDKVSSTLFNLLCGYVKKDFDKYGFANPLEEMV